MSSIRRLFVIAAIMTGILTPLRASAQVITTFDIPACLSPGCSYVFAVSINQSGTVAGYYYNSTGTRAHGFLRSSEGVITIVDVPGASLTNILSMNNRGEVVGYSSPRGGFLREAKGKYTFLRFNSPLGFQYSSATSINDHGEITGDWVDNNNGVHGFVRDKKGVYTTFDVPGAIQTLPKAINIKGAITGIYIDINGNQRGFVRDARGGITTFSGPYAATSPVAMNDKGEITGYFYDDFFNAHGFIRDAEGNITALEVSGALSTVPVSINKHGNITGGFHSGDGGSSGFEFNQKNNLITVFDVPGALYTIPLYINDNGAITGYWVDADDKYHGFVRQ